MLADYFPAAPRQSSYEFVKPREPQRAAQTLEVYPLELGRQSDVFCQGRVKKEHVLWYVGYDALPVGDVAGSELNVVDFHHPAGRTEKPEDQLGKRCLT